MTDRRRFLTGGAAVAALFAAGGRRASAAAPGEFPVTKTEAEWRAQLGEEAYAVLREEGTEPRYSSPLLDEHRKGTFHCKGCGNALYSSETKFESGTGWPSFWAAIDGAVGNREDRSFLFMVRTEEHCARCGGHLGHVFDDGPEPTGRRHCINGVALTFEPAAAEPEAAAS